MIDEDWTIRTPRGFSWLGHRLAQSVEASPLFESLGMVVSVIGARIRIVEDVHGSPDVVHQVLADLNSRAVGAAYVYWPDQRSVEVSLAHVVHHDTLVFRPKQIAAFAILSLCEAEREADNLAGRLGGRAVRETHPQLGVRTVPDDMLNVEAVFQRDGAAPSRFAVSHELQSIVDHVRGTPFASMGATAGGVCVEVPLGNATTLIELRTDVPHPHLGSGLSVKTVLPFGETHADLAAFAGRLGRGQSQTAEGVGGLGAWGVRTTNGRQHATYSRFVPNSMHSPGFALDVAMGEINRARWVDRLSAARGT